MDNQGVMPVAAEANPSNERSILWTRSLARLAFGLAIVPHVSFFLILVFWVPVKLILQDNRAAEMWALAAVEVVTLIGLLAPFLAVRVFSMTWGAQRLDEDPAQPWAFAALVAFALTVVNPFAMIAIVHMVTPPDSHKGHSSPRSLTGLYEAHDTLRNMAEQDPKKYFPPLLIRKPVSGQTDTFALVYPLKSDLGRRTYYYLGHAVTDDRTMVSFAEAYRNAMKADDLSALSGIEGEGGIARLGRVAPASRVRPDLPLPDAWLAAVPLLIEQVAVKGPGEGAVLFADGHVEDIAYPGRWPMTETTMRLLEEMAATDQAPSGSAEGE